MTPYSQARSTIQDGDVLLFRGRGLVSWLIRSYGRSPYSHAAMALWVGNVLLCLEIREFKCGRAVTLSSQVRKYSGRIDVYRPSSYYRYDGAGAAVAMLRKCGSEYGYWGVVVAWLRHLPFVRLAMPLPRENGGSATHREYCSEAVANAMRTGGGLDVHRLPDRACEPADLGWSEKLTFKHALKWDDK